MKYSTKKAYPLNWSAICQGLYTQRGRRCQNCGTRPIRRNTLTVHHIDYNPANNNPDNLVILCQKCHLKVQAIDRQAGVWDPKRPSPGGMSG